jgi:transposase InsO family protein
MKEYSIVGLSRIAGYSRDGYYKSSHAKSHEILRYEVVAEAVRVLRREHPRMGGKKLYHMLGDLAGELHFGRDRFFDILRAESLLVSHKRSFTRTTQSYHYFRVYRNELKNIVITAPNRAWASDITYIRTAHGFMYLFLLTDVYSRKIVGWDLSNSLSVEGGIRALKQALKQCSTTKDVIHHSDRGIQYCCHEYVKLLRKEEMKISMTEENHCYENAMAERVNGILKNEYLLDSTFRNGTIAKKACAEAIATYNFKRPHWALELKTPQEVHKQVA